MINKQQWKEGTVQEFLGLSDANMAVVEIKIALITNVKCGDMTLYLHNLNPRGV